MRRATAANGLADAPPKISIHALLAESDKCAGKASVPTRYFYPRSPCGERLTLQDTHHFPTLFLSTLSLRRATLLTLLMGAILIIFLSTLSLRRATFGKIMSVSSGLNFYPRSPCGERRRKGSCRCVLSGISIHALLAESDKKSFRSLDTGQIFLSTLSLRRATSNSSPYSIVPPFLSTLSLRRATNSRTQAVPAKSISIHALLAESDFGSKFLFNLLI